jgi:hypothetical protein
MSQEQDVFQSPPGSSEGSREGSSGGAGLEPGPHPHDFDVQKQIHQQIRNDPDYDDWEYGTEPLPHEAWVVRSERAAAEAAADDSACPPA